MTEPRHVELERRLVAEGWERCRHRDGLGARAYVHNGLGLVAYVPPGDEPPGEGYDAIYRRDCDHVEERMAQARGETWAGALREVRELRAEVERRRSDEAGWERALSEMSEACLVLEAEVARLHRIASMDGKELYEEHGRLTERIFDDGATEQPVALAFVRARLGELEALDQVAGLTLCGKDPTLKWQCDDLEEEAGRLRSRNERLERALSTLAALAPGCGCPDGCSYCEAMALAAALDEADGTEPERGGA